MKTKCELIQALSIAVALLAVGSLQAQAAVVFNNAGPDQNWSTTANWVGGALPGIGDDVQLNNANFIMDMDDTVKSIYSSFGTVSGISTSAGGTLTIDINSGAALNGVYTAYNKDDEVTRLEFDGNVTIQNSGGTSVNTYIGVKNARDNATLAFGPNSVLTLNSQAQTLANGTVELNGTLAGSQALRIAASNVILGDGHDSSGFNNGFVFISTGAKMTVNGGTVLSSARKFQVNAAGVELEINAADSVEGFFSLTDAASILLDVNADQSSLGRIILGAASGFMIDMEGVGSQLAFAQSTDDWQGSTVVISNFISEVVRFGSDSNGLLAANMDNITAYDRTGAVVPDLAINTNGFLTGSVTAPQQYIFSNDSLLDSGWSNTGNWSTATLPTPNDFVQLNNANFVMDTDATVRYIYSSFGTANGTSSSSGGTLTVDIYSTTAQDGIWSAYNASNDVSTITFDGSVTIYNSRGTEVDTLIGVKSDRPNATLAFGSNSVLTLNSRVETMGTGYGTIELNGTLLGSQPIRINSGTVVLGTGHDSSSWGNDFVFVGVGSKLVVDGGTVLVPSRKVQVNADGEIELNSTDSFNGYLSLANSKQFLVDVNANQDAMGRVVMGTDATMTLDLAAGVTDVSFAESADDWQTSTLVISNFSNGVVSFGTDTNGLLAANLDNIVAYDAGGSPLSGLQIDSTGHLTTDASVPVGDISIGIINGGAGITMSWASTNGATYTVSNTTDLVNGPWTLWTNGLIGTGGDLVITDAVDEVQSFYKISGQ